MRFSYHARATALHDITFDVAADCVIGLVGPNGSGKSTLMKLIVDLLASRRGSIRVDSLPNSSKEAKVRAMYIASNDYVPEFLTGHEYLRFLHGLYGEKVDDALETRLFQRYQMEGRASHLIEDYSHGMRKKLQLIAALMLSRKLTIIDETLNGIDIDAVYAFEEDVAGLSSEGRSVILCSHDLPLLQRVADRTLLLHRGALLVDAVTSELVSDFGSLDAMMRELVEVAR